MIVAVLLQRLFCARFAVCIMKCFSDLYWVVVPICPGSFGNQPHDCRFQLDLGVLAKANDQVTPKVLRQLSHGSFSWWSRFLHNLCLRNHWSTRQLTFGLSLFGFWQPCISAPSVSPTTVIVLATGMQDKPAYHYHCMYHYSMLLSDPMEKVECHLEELGTWIPLWNQ